MTTDKQRKTLADLMDAMVYYHRHFHYAQIRPMATNSIHLLRPAILRWGGITMDCSEAVTFLCRLAGLRDPNGLHYNGSGYTGTLLEYLPHYFNPAGAMIGALCVFGDGSGEHVTMVRKPGPDPTLFSMGGEGDPKFARLSWMQPGFSGATTFLNISKLGV